MCAAGCCRYCLLSRSSLRVKDSELRAGQEYALMSDDLIMVHAAMELGKQVGEDSAVTPRGLCWAWVGMVGMQPAGDPPGSFGPRSWSVMHPGLNGA